MRPANRLGVLTLVCGTALGCGPLPGRPKPGPEVPRPDAVVDFRTLYRENCSGCHGADGMNGPSYPLANPKYQALVNETLLHQVVANGEPGTLMPAFAKSVGGSLTEAQVDALVHGMRSAWYKGDALTGSNPPAYRAIKTADVAHGQQVYATYCASCHGDAAGSKAGSLTEPAFLALVSDQVLRTVIIAGRPDIGQPDWRSDVAGRAMSEQEVTDVVGWLASQRPAGVRHKKGVTP